MESYNKNDFENLVNNILKKAEMDCVKFFLRDNQSSKKWYDKHYTDVFENITENTIYGVFYDGLIQYDFKVGKIENLLKSFLLKHSGRFSELRKSENGRYKFVSIKNEVLNKIIESNKDRVLHGMFYTTLYGIGFWCIFSSKQDMETAKSLHVFLKSKGVEYYNEFSDAGWVYRFCINKDVKFHNELLKSFKEL